jgi:hypothetical protein
MSNDQIKTKLMNDRNFIGILISVIVVISSVMVWVYSNYQTEEQRKIVDATNDRLILTKLNNLANRTDNITVILPNASIADATGKISSLSPPIILSDADSNLTK